MRAPQITPSLVVTLGGSPSSQQSAGDAAPALASPRLLHAVARVAVRTGWAKSLSHVLLASTAYPVKAADCAQAS